jgi:hypothetical protein
LLLLVFVDLADFVDFMDLVDFVDFVVFAAGLVDFIDFVAVVFVVVLAAVVLPAAMAVPVMRNAAAIIDASSFFNAVPSFLCRIGAVDSPQRGAALCGPLRYLALPTKLREMTRR